MALKTGFPRIGLGDTGHSLAFPCVPVKNASIFPGQECILPHLLSSLPSSFTKVLTVSDSVHTGHRWSYVHPGLHHHGTVGKKGDSLMCKDIVRAGSMPQRESVPLLAMLRVGGTDTAVRTLVTWSRLPFLISPLQVHPGDSLWSVDINRYYPHRDLNSTCAFGLLPAFVLLGILKPRYKEPKSANRRGLVEVPHNCVPPSSHVRPSRSSFLGHSDRKGCIFLPGGPQTSLQIDGDLLP